MSTRSWRKVYAGIRCWNWVKNEEKMSSFFDQFLPILDDSQKRLLHWLNLWLQWISWRVFWRKTKRKIVIMVPWNSYTKMQHNYPLNRTGIFFFPFSANPHLQWDYFSFDIVFSNWLFMYLSDEETEQLLQKSLSWLKPGGTLFFRESCFHSSGKFDRNQWMLISIDLFRKYQTRWKSNTLSFSSTIHRYVSITYSKWYTWTTAWTSLWTCFCQSFGIVLRDQTE